MSLVGQSRPFGDVCSMSGLPPKADFPILDYSRRQFFANAAIAASRVAS